MNLLQAGDLPYFSTFYQYFLKARDWLEVRSSSRYLNEGHPPMICSFSLYAYSGFLSIYTYNKTWCGGQESNLRFCPCSTGVLLITLFTTNLKLGVAGRIWTDGFTVLQTVPLGHSGTATLIVTSVIISLPTRRLHRRLKSGISSPREAIGDAVIIHTSSCMLRFFGGRYRIRTYGKHFCDLKFSKFLHSSTLPIFHN